MEASGLRTKLRIGLAYGLGVGLVAFLFWRNWPEVYRLVQHPPRPGWILAGWAFCFGGVIVTFLRWYLLVRAQGLEFFFSDAVRLGFVGYLFNQLIPGAVSGDLVKVGFFAREQERLAVGAATVVVDRLVGTYALFLLGSCVVLVFGNQLAQDSRLSQAGLLVVGAAAIATGLLLGLLTATAVPGLAAAAERIPLIGQALGEVVRTLAVYRGHYGVLLLALALGLLAHGCFASALRCAALALPGENWPLWVHCIGAPIGLTINAIPLTAGGIGLGEAGMQQTFELLGYDGAKAFLMMLAFRAMGWSISLLGIPFLARSLTQRRRFLTGA
jgi:uncharacterized membrane protein YbhN (UPF0104 family)